jgi:hypothetical protein
VWPFPGGDAPFDESKAEADWQLQYNTRWTPAIKSEVLGDRVNSN